MYRTKNGYVPTKKESKILKSVYPSAQPAGIAVGSQKKKRQRKN